MQSNELLYKAVFLHSVYIYILHFTSSTGPTTKEFTKPAKVPAATLSNKVSCPGVTQRAHLPNSFADITIAVINGIVENVAVNPL